jgi:hypothetical protein
LEEKERKNASKVVLGRAKDGQNRHVIPINPTSISLIKPQVKHSLLRRSLQPLPARKQTETSCFDTLIEERKYNVMPRNMSFRKPEDSPEKVPLTEE